MTTPTSDRSSDNESGGELAATLKAAAVFMALCIRDWDTSDSNKLEMKDAIDEIVAVLERNQPDTLHTELHRLRAERAALLAACEVSIELITDLQSRCATTDGAHLETSMMSVPVVNRLKEIIANAKGTTNE